MAFLNLKLPFKRPENKVVLDAIPFQDGIGTVTEDGPTGFMMSTYYIIMSMFLVMVVVAFTARTDSVVVGEGHLTTDTPPIQLQPVDRAIIRQLRVRPGDTVKKGQVLATFDPTFARADLVSLVAQQQSLEAQVRRLESEWYKTPFEVSDASNPDERLQSALLQQRQMQYESRLRIFDEQIQGIKASITTTKESRGPLAELLGISKDIESKRRTLASSGTGTNLQYQDAQASRIRTEQDLQNTNNRLIELQHGLSSKQAERDNFVDDWLRQVMDRLVVTRDELAKINELVTKSKRINDFEELTAPVDGVVLEVAKRTVGAVLPGAEVLITLVPADATFIAEIKIPSGDIGYIKLGGDVIIKIHAFPYRTHGTLEGKLRFISHESYHGGGAASEGGGGSGGGGSGGGGAFHSGRVELQSTKLRNLPEGVQLIRGMTLSAEIKVGNRSIASYILNPLMRSFTESMREP